jgi:hypothetical protein
MREGHEMARQAGSQARQAGSQARQAADVGSPELMADQDRETISRVADISDEEFPSGNCPSFRQLRKMISGDRSPKVAYERMRNT